MPIFKSRYIVKSHLPSRVFLLLFCLQLPFFKMISKTYLLSVIGRKQYASLKISSILYCHGTAEVILGYANDRILGKSLRRAEYHKRYAIGNI